jgi:membrane protein DedA with SNARE-associated domain
VLDLRAWLTYLAVFVALVAAGVGFPIPEELPILTAGAMSGHAAEEPAPPVEIVAALAAAPAAGWPAALPWPALYAAAHAEPPPHRIPLRWWIFLPVCILGVVISDGLLYGMGRFWGPRLFEKRWVKRFLPGEKRQRIEENFHKYGVLVLLFARLLPAIRSPIFIMAGVMRLSLARFLLADGIYAIPGVSLLFALAFWFGDQVRDLILRAEGKLKSVLILVALSAVAAYLLYHFLRHPFATGDPQEEMPLVGPQIASKIEQRSHSDLTANREAAADNGAEAAKEHSPPDVSEQR